MRHRQCKLHSPAQTVIWLRVQSDFTVLRNLPDNLASTYTHRSSFFRLLIVIIEAGYALCGPEAT